MRTAGSALLDAFQVKSEVMELTESPIEGAVLTSLLLGSSYVATELDLSGRGIEPKTYRAFFVEREDYRALVVPQLKIQGNRGRYRLDFAAIVERNGRRLYAAIECDGLQFHSEPDDVKRDKARDRDLAEKGWLTLRFPGSEIKGGAWSQGGQVWACLAALSAVWCRDDLDITANVPGSAA